MGDTQQFDELAIRGFRGLSSLHLDGLGTINILLGANDVGKTSVLEAIFLLTGLAEPKLPVRVQNGRNYLVHEIDDFSSIFFELDSDTRVELVAYSRDPEERRELIISAPHRESSIDNKNQRIRSGTNGHGMSTRQDKRKGNQSSSTLFGSRVLRYDVAIQSSFRNDPTSFSVMLVDHGDKWGVIKDPDELDAAGFNVPAKFLAARFGYETETISELIVNKKDDILLRYLSVINPQVKRVTVHGDVAYLDIGLPKMMALNMFGSGMMRAAMILSECVLKDERILLIDEIENGLHYKAIVPLLEVLLRLAEERKVQVFATTHSIDVLQGLEQVLSQQDFSRYRATTVCFTLQRDKDGLVRSYRYEHDQFAHCIEHSIEIR